MRQALWRNYKQIAMFMQAACSYCSCGRHRFWGLQGRQATTTDDLGDDDQDAGMGRPLVQDDWNDACSKLNRNRAISYARLEC